MTSYSIEDGNKLCIKPAAGEIFKLKMCYSLAKFVLFGAFLASVTGDSCSEDNNLLKYATASNCSDCLVIENIQNVTQLQGVNDVLIKDKNISIICAGSFKDLPPLRKLTFSYDGINEIQPGAFGNQLNVEHLRFIGNQISTIEKGVFNGLKIRELHLPFNSIRTIKKGAFDDMPELTTVCLSSNSLFEIDPDWFSGKTLFPTNVY